MVLPCDMEPIPDTNIGVMISNAHKESSSWQTLPYGPYGLIGITDGKRLTPRPCEKGTYARIDVAILCIPDKIYYL